MPLLDPIPKKIRLWFKSRRLARFRRSPKIFVPTPTRWQIVVPFKAISVFLIVFLMLASGYLLLRSDVFLVGRIQVIKEDGWEKKEFIPESQIKKKLTGLLAKSIFTVSDKEIKARLQGELLEIKELHFERKLPDQLIIYYSERKPVAVIKIQKVSEEAKFEKNEKGEKVKRLRKVVAIESYFVDNKGLVFAKKEGEFELPEFELTGLRNLNVGDQIDNQTISAALAIAEKINSLNGLKLKNVIINEPDELRVVFANGMVVLFSATAKSIGQQISSLQTVYRRATMEGRKIRSVDLRFDNPVVH